MVHNYIYLALVHGKWKFGACGIVKARFKPYNSGNYNFSPSLLYVVDEGHEEQVSILENKITSKLYDYLENPSFLNKPTEYVNPDFTYVDNSYIENVIETIIKDRKLLFLKVKQKYLKESIKDNDFLYKIRMFPKTYLDNV
jgi:hypothetical protein